jgi:hypothetical protein
MRTRLKKKKRPPLPLASPSYYGLSLLSDNAPPDLAGRRARKETDRPVF